MHSEVEVFNSIVTMTDGAEAKAPYGNFSFMITLDTAEEVTEIFGKLAVGGRITQPLANQWWSAWCGEVVDQFGITWWLGTE
jgi:PhnB protein